MKSPFGRNLTGFPKLASLTRGGGGPSFPSDYAAYITASEALGAAFSPALPAAANGYRTTTADYYSAATGSRVQHVFAVARTNSEESGIEPFLLAHTPATPGDWWADSNAFQAIAVNSFSGFYSTRSRGSSANFVSLSMSPAPAWNTNNFMLFEMFNEGVTFDYVVDDVPRAEATVEAAVSGGALTRFTISNAIVGSTDIAALVVFNRVLTETERDLVVAWASEIRDNLN